jgi:hypothetical protein
MNRIKRTSGPLLSFRIPIRMRTYFEKMGSGEFHFNWRSNNRPNINSKPVQSHLIDVCSKSIFEAICLQYYPHYTYTIKYKSSDTIGSSLSTWRLTVVVPMNKTINRMGGKSPTILLLPHTSMRDLWGYSNCAAWTLQL